jgi:hypothetical protein
MISTAPRTDQLNPATATPESGYVTLPRIRRTRLDPV